MGISRPFLDPPLSPLPSPGRRLEQSREPWPPGRRMPWQVSELPSSPSCPGDATESSAEQGTPGATASRQKGWETPF